MLNHLQTRHLESIFLVFFILSITSMPAYPSDITKLDNRQKDTLNKLLKQNRSNKLFNIYWNKKYNIPMFISGYIAPLPYKLNGEKEKQKKEEAIAREFFEINKDLFKIDNQKDELALAVLQKDSLNRKHLRFKQLFKGIEVFGAELAIHMDHKNIITSVNGNYIPDIDLKDITPEISKDETIAKAKVDLGDKDAVINNQNLVIGSGDFVPVELQEVKLLWKIVLSSVSLMERWTYLIDASNGEIVFKFESIKSLKNRQTYSAEYDGMLPGKLLFTELGATNTNSEGIDEVGWKAHKNVGIVYDYYSKFFF